MPQLKPALIRHKQSYGLVGVGLRHPHYQAALNAASSIDFVEVHAENFFAEGGLIAEYLQALQACYPISLHATSLGLGSAIGIDTRYLDKLARLVSQINPLLVSDHASFSWSRNHDGRVHAGDLLPLEFTEQGLEILVANVDRVQQRLGRRLLVENLSAYIAPQQAQMHEAEFLAKLVERSQCGLLLDLNNLLVNASNLGYRDPLSQARSWLNYIPLDAVGEFHLAGYTPAQKGELIIDDHSQPVSEQCWELYRTAISRFGPVTTLVEWDNDLPDWHVLVGQAEKARELVQDVCRSHMEASYGRVV